MLIIIPRYQRLARQKTGEGNRDKGIGLRGLEHRIYELFSLVSVLPVIYNHWTTLKVAAWGQKTWRE